MTTMTRPVAADRTATTSADSRVRRLFKALAGSVAVAFTAVDDDVRKMQLGPEPERMAARWSGARA